MWTGTTLVWTGWQTTSIAAAIGVEAGGAFAWAESRGPRHPDRDLHNWTQEGQELCGRFPNTTYAERSAPIAAERAAQESALVAALADHGGMTREEAVGWSGAGRRTGSSSTSGRPPSAARCTQPAGRSRRGRSASRCGTPSTT
ncbi:hypothetical protein ACFYYS_25920 [Streptomyces sp. NPDC002120]|uniref:hypothetical protein n=1 Tax=Streptomyces sp. NPDC002120 TaxID=3364631 RepID=UPI0036C98087